MQGRQAAPYVILPPDWLHDESVYIVRSLHAEGQVAPSRSHTNRPASSLPPPPPCVCLPDPHPHLCDAESGRLECRTLHSKNLRPILMSILHRGAAHQFLSGYQLNVPTSALINIKSWRCCHATCAPACIMKSTARSASWTSLGMKGTPVTMLTPQMRDAWQSGTDPIWIRAELGTSRAPAGRGVLRSSVNDMPTFLAANLGVTKTPLAARPWRGNFHPAAAGTADMQIAYGPAHPDEERKFDPLHNGGTVPVTVLTWALIRRAAPVSWRCRTLQLLWVPTTSEGTAGCQRPLGEGSTS